MGLRGGREKTWGVTTFILFSTPRKTGVNANAHSKEQIALGFCSRYQPPCFACLHMVTIQIHRECRSESGIITSSAQGLNRPRGLWSIAETHQDKSLSLHIYFFLALCPHYACLAGLMRGWKIPNWSSLFSVCSAVLSFTKRGGEKRNILSFHSKEEKIKVVWLL